MPMSTPTVATEAMSSLRTTTDITYQATPLLGKATSGQRFLR
jgi:hypothetical protein